MKVFFFPGRNAENLSGMSWKLWKIERKGRTVIAYWGPVRDAAVEEAFRRSRLNEPSL